MAFKQAVLDDYNLTTIREVIVGQGLRKVAKLCGGLVVKNKDTEVHYDGDGKKVKVIDRKVKVIDNEKEPSKESVK